MGSAASTTPSPASATPAATTSSPRRPSRVSSAPSQPSSQPAVRRAGSSSSSVSPGPCRRPFSLGCVAHTRGGVGCRDSGGGGELREGRAHQARRLRRLGHRHDGPPVRPARFSPESAGSYTAFPPRFQHTRAHRGPGYTLNTAGSAMESVRLTYRGKNSHAAGAPWDGVNALNAVIQVRRPTA